MFFLHLIFVLENYHNPLDNLYIFTIKKQKIRSVLKYIQYIINGIIASYDSVLQTYSPRRPKINDFVH